MYIVRVVKCVVINVGANPKCFVKLLQNRYLDRKNQNSLCTGRNVSFYTVRDFLNNRQLSTMLKKGATTLKCIKCLDGSGRLNIVEREETTAVRGGAELEIQREKMW